MLFKDSTVKLIHLKKRNTTKLWLSEKYFLGLKTLSSCYYMAAVSKSFANKLESLARKRFSMISLTIIVFVLPQCWVFLYLACLKMYAIKERGERDSILIYCSRRGLVQLACQNVRLKLCITPHCSGLCFLKKVHLLEQTC